MSGRARRKRAKDRSVVRQAVEYAAARAVSAVARVLGTKGRTAVAHVLAAVARRLIRGRTELALRNLALAFPHLPSEEHQRIVRRVWTHLLDVALEYARSVGSSGEEIVAGAEMTGRERLEAVLQSPRGILIVSAHFGHWETIIDLIGTLPRPVTIIARPLDNRFLERDLRGGRARSGVTVLDRRGAARPMVRALSDKEIVALLPDQAVRPADGVLVPFLGRDCWTTPVPARIALRTSALILPVFCVREGERVRFEIGEVIDPKRFSGSAAAAEELTRAINDVLSARIRRDPHLWLWLHDRWKWTDRK